VDDGPVSEVEEERERKARSHLFSGVAAFVVALIAVPVYGVLPAIAMVVFGIGAVLASRSMRREGEVAPAARCVLLAVQAFSG
jgi:hypothetical protein